MSEQTLELAVDMMRAAARLFTKLYPDAQAVFHGSTAAYYYGLYTNMPKDVDMLVSVTHYQQALPPLDCYRDPVRFQFAMHDAEQFEGNVFLPKKVTYLVLRIAGDTHNRSLWVWSLLATYELVELLAIQEKLEIATALPGYGVAKEKLEALIASKR